MAVLRLTKAVAALGVIPALVSLGTLGQSVQPKTIHLGVSIHAVHEWGGQLVLDDWQTGVVYILDLATGVAHRSPVTTSPCVCDIEVDGDVLSAVSENGQQVEQYDLLTGAQLAGVGVPATSGLSDFDIQGYERTEGVIYLLGCSNSRTECGRHLHRIVTLDTVSGELLGVATGHTCGELVGLQATATGLWTFEYSAGLLWEVRLDQGVFRLARSWDVVSRIQARQMAEGGPRSCYLGEGFIAVMSIWGYKDNQDSHIHLIGYPGGFPR